MKNSFYEDLTPKQQRQAFLMRDAFPKTARGHGSQHRDVFDTYNVIAERCNAVGCNGERHRQQPLEAAAKFVVARDQ